ncbi:MAG: hypothetical protein ACRD1V_15770 [Vicinamibacterales bacterium]
MTLPVRAGAVLMSAMCCMWLSSSLATAAPQAQSTKRVVRIGVLNVAPGAHEVQIVIREGEAASMKDDVGSFKFVPTLQKGDDKTVVLKVLDADSGQQIDQLRLTAGGKPAQPKGLPFQLEIISVTTPK